MRLASDFRADNNLEPPRRSLDGGAQGVLVSVSVLSLWKWETLEEKDVRDTMVDVGGLLFCEWLRFISTTAGPWGLRSEQQSCHS